MNRQRTHATVLEPPPSGEAKLYQATLPQPPFRDGRWAAINTSIAAKRAALVGIPIDCAGWPDNALSTPSGGQSRVSESAVGESLFPACSEQATRRGAGLGSMMPARPTPRHSLPTFHLLPDDAGGGSARTSEKPEIDNLCMSRCIGTCSGTRRC
jgi:hypothetical protein